MNTDAVKQQTISVTENNNTDVKKYGFGVRHIQCFLLFLGITIAYTNRLYLSVAIIEIKQETNLSSDHDGYILSSFFWGYTLMNIPSAYIAKLWSAKLVLTYGILFNGILSLLFPLINNYGWEAACACRVVMGLTQACLLPCVHTFLSKWASPSERGRLGSLTYSGAQFGTVVCYPISGVLIEAAGWRSVCYFFGTLTILWSSVFLFLGSDSPDVSKNNLFLQITHPEKEYIEKSLGVHSEDKSEQKKSLKTPWKAIATSVPFWSLIVAHCGQNWGFWMLLTEMPKYMSGVLNFDIKENGLKSALPYLTMLILTFPVSWLSDYIQKKGLSRGLVRKLCNSVGHFGPGLAILGLAFVPLDNPTVPVVILIAAVGFNVGTLCGFQINHIDLSPNFAGVLMSITNCLAGIVAILAPIIVGFIVTDDANISQWKIVFYITTVIYFIGNSIFIAFGSGDVQPWNDSKNIDSNQSTVINDNHSNLPAVSNKNKLERIFSRETSSISTINRTVP